MFRSTSQFDKLLDKATSNLKLEPDWPVILQICDLIRQGDVQPKQALAAIKKKMASSNPHVAMFSLIVLESCVKNCGSLIHDEIGTKASMEQLRETIKTTTHENVKAKLLELIQAWAYAFRNSPKYRAVHDTVNIMKAEGYKFPALKESDAMFSADTAPGWADGDCCHRCRVPFTLLQRKHHCRACGQVFCAQCTAKTCTLPKFGIEKEVRVCEACYEKVNKPPAANKADDLPLEYLTSSLAQQSQAPPPRKSDAELKEEEELQLAIALSQSEAEQKSKSTRSTPVAATRTKSYSPPPKLSTSPEADPELARYLNRSYWQQQSAEYSNASAPVMSATSTPPKQTVVPEQNGVEESEMEEFVSNLQSQVEIFVNRMKSNSSRGRSIANDSSVQTLFMNITAMHSKLLRYIQQQDDRRVYFEGLQDKLAQVKDARAALDALREEHREKLRREAEIAERQRQLQMAQKLDIMRKKKQEYLQYQRQLALQRIQEQEREMQIRQEQQKQQYLIESQYGTLPYMRTVPPVQLYGHPRGVPMMMDQPRPPMDQPGLMMHGQPGMIPPGMVPQNMIPMGPPGSLPPNMQLMGQHNTGQPQPALGPPQGLQGPASMAGSQPLQNQLPGLTMPQSISSRPSMGGSQTLPRQSVGVSQVLQGPPSLGGPPPPIQGQPVMGVPQTIPGQPPVSLPQPLQNQQPVSGQPPIGQQPALNVPQSMQGVPQMLQGPPTMNGPHSMQTQPTMSGPQTTPGMPLGNQPITHPSIPPMPQPSVPQMAPQNIATMMVAHPGQQQTGPSMPQQPFQPPAPPSQPQQEDKTAELISFD